MSVAALEALALHHVLASGRDDLWTRIFERASDIVDDAWIIAVRADFEFPPTTGPKPIGTDLVNTDVARLNPKAHPDGRLAEAFARDVSMERRPIRLVRPSVRLRVLKS